MDTMVFPGEAFDIQIDGPRLTAQYERIRDFFQDHQWHTLHEAARLLGYPHGSVGSQVRNLRMERYGGFTIIRRRTEDESGLWEYRMLPPTEIEQQQAA